MWPSLFSAGGESWDRSLSPSFLASASFGQREPVLLRDWKLFDIITFVILLGYSNKEQWPLTSTGRYNENTVRHTVPRTNKPAFFPASMTLAPLWLTRANVKSWPGETQPAGVENWVMPSNHLRWIFPFFWTQSKWTFNVLTSKTQTKTIKRDPFACFSWKPVGLPIAVTQSPARLCAGYSKLPDRPEHAWCHFCPQHKHAASLTAMAR